MARVLGGVKRSDPARLAHRVSLAQHPTVGPLYAAHVAGDELLPDEVDWGSLAPGLDHGGIDQGEDENCVPSSGAGVVASSFAAQGQPLPFVPGIKLPGAGTRALERAHAAVVGPVPALTDTGMEIADYIAFIARYGVCDRLLTPGLVNGLTPDGRFSDAWPANVDDEPDFALLLKSGRKLVVGPYGVDPAQAGVSDLLAAAIAKGVLSQNASFVDTAFQNLAANAVAGAPNEGDPQGGGHATYLNGYLVVRTATQASTYGVPTGTRLFWLQNSWSRGWCANGRCLVGPAWISAAWEFHPYAVVS